MIFMRIPRERLTGRPTETARRLAILKVLMRSVIEDNDA